ncbi:signal peptide-containing protein [Theileria equi strain WA]|uniref:Signal peptide-containing protein n=1 Tax=Theileria equi strain WA TaxID=1537102 RepID=L0AYV4_THEEQ|nr:signal peptide-containing protein [Theileria equi strain WA]AFZ80777.1 signal peptide-containing protein [Theileria equi strain WA]|eukprot:XP_004830443.1 signal peptide-containing protein [Theileria equi strain WA]
MKVASPILALYVLCILRTCKCGDDKDAESKTCDHHGEEECTEQDIYPGINVPSEPKHFVTLDISDMDPQVCRVIDTYMGRVSVRVYIIHPKFLVKKVMDRNTEVWEGIAEDHCVYMVTFLKSSKPKIVLLRVKETMGSYQVFRKFKSGNGCYSSSGGWYPSVKSSSKKIERLSIFPCKTRKFALDISLDEGNDKYRVIKPEYDTIAVRYYVPKSGYAIGRIKEGNQVIGQLKDDFTCYLCEFFSLENYALLRVHTERNYRSWLCWYERVDGQWRDVEEESFIEDLHRIRLSARLSKYSGAECKSTPTSPH